MTSTPLNLGSIGHHEQQRLESVRFEAARMQPILERYDAILSRATDEVRQEPNPGTNPHHLRWMIGVLAGRVESFANGKLTPLKMHRWLGFIQGTMIAHGVLTVAEERELTRQYLTEH